MPEILRLRKSYKEFSAGTLFVLEDKRTQSTKGNCVRVKSLSSMLVTRRSGRLHRPELEIPIGYLDEYKSHTFIVPTINGRERRRKIRKTVRSLRNLTRESEQLPGGYR